MKKPILKLYYELLERKRLYYGNGLCTEILMAQQDINYRLQDEFKDLFTPTGREMCEFFGRHQLYWGEDETFSLGWEFGPTRENLLLLFAAVKGEL